MTTIVNFVDNLTKEEIEYAIKAINKKRYYENLEERKKIAKVAFEAFISVCEELNITPHLKNGYYPIDNILKEKFVYFDDKGDFN